MKCIIPSQNVKIVARAIHSLSRIGDELYIEPTNTDLTFCSISSAQSALCEFKMSRSFFSSYSFTVDDSDIKCKVAMKSCLGVFKNPHCADRQVESCELRLKSEGTLVIFYIKYTNSSTKKFFLPVIECEKVEVNYERDAPNRVVASSKLLLSSFKNFRSNEDEITVKVSGDNIVIKNHLEPGRDKGLMRTELSFQPSEFECCTVNSPTAVTFTLKEMRAAINFAEPANLPLQIHITKPGDPLVLKVAYLPAYESTYVIATLRSSQKDLETTVSQLSTVPNTQSGNRPLQQPTSIETVTYTSQSAGKSKDDIAAGPTHLITLQELPLDQSENNAPLPLATLSKPHNQNALSQFSSSKNNLSNTLTEQPMEIDGDIATDSLMNSSNIELVKKIFQQCFTKSFIFYLLPGHDVVLCNMSDSE